MSASASASAAAAAEVQVQVQVQVPPVLPARYNPPDYLVFTDNTTDPPTEVTISMSRTNFVTAYFDLQVNRSKYETSDEFSAPFLSPFDYLHHLYRKCEREDPLRLYDVKNALCIHNQWKTHRMQETLLNATKLDDERITVINGNQQDPENNRIRGTLRYHLNATQEFFTNAGKFAQLKDVLRNPSVSLQVARRQSDFFVALFGEQNRANLRKLSSLQNGYDNLRKQRDEALNLTAEDFKSGIAKDLKDHRRRLTCAKKRLAKLLEEVDFHEKALERVENNWKRANESDDYYHESRNGDIEKFTKKLNDLQPARDKARELARHHANVYATYTAQREILSRGDIGIRDIVYLLKRHSLSKAQYALSCLNVYARRAVNDPDVNGHALAILRAAADTRQIAICVALFL